MNIKTTTLALTLIFTVFSAAFAGAGTPANGGKTKLTDKQQPRLRYTKLNRQVVEPPGGSLLSTTYSNLQVSFGMEIGQYRYYNLKSFSENARLLRISSEPSFRRTWETSWHMQLSWIKGSGNPGNAEFRNLSDGVNPLVFNGSASLMFNPLLAGHPQAVSLRLLSSVGVETGSYIPEFRFPGISSTENNVGKTTGIGPRLGAGFAVSTGAVTFYSMGTVSKGGITRSNQNKYSSLEAAAGIRLGNALHIRYSIGENDWAIRDMKKVRFNRVMLGVGLNSLFGKK